MTDADLGAILTRAAGFAALSPAVGGSYLRDVTALAVEICRLRAAPVMPPVTPMPMPAPIPTPMPEAIP